MATWAMRQRYAWINERAAAGESFTRADVVKAFTVTTQTVSATMREFEDLYPNVVRYCVSRKAFVRADMATVPKGRRAMEHRVRDVLTWMEERGRNSRSFGSHADAYEIAARKLREALGMTLPVPPRDEQVADRGPGRTPTDPLEVK